jgi:hypothetical protein
VAVARPKENPRVVQDEPKMEALPKLLNHEIDMSGLGLDSMPPSPPPPPPPPPPAPPLATEKLIVEPTTSAGGTNINPSKRSSFPPTFAKSFTIASLQQYTNSFSQDNLIGLGMLGSVYRAELPNGKVKIVAYHLILIYMK